MLWVWGGDSTEDLGQEGSARPGRPHRCWERQLLSRGTAPAQSPGWGEGAGGHARMLPAGPGGGDGRKEGCMHGACFCVKRGSCGTDWSAFPSCAPS